MQERRRRIAFDRIAFFLEKSRDPLLAHEIFNAHHDKDALSLVLLRLKQDAELFRHALTASKREELQKSFFRWVRASVQR